MVVYLPSPPPKPQQKGVSFEEVDVSVVFPRVQVLNMP
jgi:hypothetical protein